MACDSGGEVRPQEPLPEQHRRPLLVVDAPVLQAHAPQRRRRLRAASRGGGAVVLGTAARPAPAQLGAVVMLPRRAPTGEEEQVDAVHHGVAEKDAKVRDMNTIGMLLRGDAGVSQVNAIGSVGLYWFLIGTSSTQEPRTVWLLLKNDARIFQGNTYGPRPIRMAALQNMCFHKNSACMIPWDSSSLQKNQLMKKESGGWLLDDELGDFNRCYTGLDASAGLVSSIFSAQVARMKSQCNLKQGSMFEIALEIAQVNTRVPFKWPLGTSVDDLLSYLQDPKADKTRGTGQVECRDATEGCVMLLLLVVDDKTSPPTGVVEEGVSTKRSIWNSAVDEALSIQDASRDPNQTREALLCWIHQFNQFGLEHKLDWRSLPPLLNAAKVRDIMLLRGGADVNKVDAIGSIALYCFLIGTSRTHKPRTVWLLLKNDARIFRRNTYGPVHMAVFRNMRFNRNSASMIPWDTGSIPKNQAMNMEGGDWLLDDELDDFKRRYTGPDVWYSTRKALVIGLKRGNQMQPQGIGSIQSEREEVVNAKDHMAVPRASLPAELQRATSHSMLDGEISKDEHNLHKWCLLPIQCLLSWFFIFRKWLLGFSVVAAKQLVLPLDVVPGRNGPAANMVYLQLLSQPKSEFAESNSDYQYPMSPLIANITGDSHDIECRQLDPCNESNNVESQKGSDCRLSNVDSHEDGDSAKNDNSVIPIFVRHVSGELVLTVSLDQPLQHLMNLYAQKTKTKLEYQYFVHGRKTLQPDHTFLFYGVERDTTIHVCTRLLGGIVTIEEYLIHNKERFLAEVTLPDRRVSLIMTKEGCLFLSTWLKCFTSAFANFKSWEGDFTLKDFKVVNGHVQAITNAKSGLTSSSMKADLVKLVQYISTIFFKNKSNLVSKFPPYLENLMTFLQSYKYPFLSDDDKLFIETHMCCVESASRGMLLVWLRRKYKSLTTIMQKEWQLAMRDRIGSTKFAKFSDLSEVAVFKEIIAHVQKSESYTESKNSTFRLMRDGFMHGPSKRFDKSTKPWKEKFKNDDGIELMIPAYNKDLIPNILHNWIKSTIVDIKSELLAVQVRCTCSMCHHPSRSGSKGGGESSTAGKGKQPAQAAASPGFSQPASPVQSAANPWFSQPASRSFLDVAKSASPITQSSSRFSSSASSQDTKGKGKQRKY